MIYLAADLKMAGLANADPEHGHGQQVCVSRTLARLRCSHAHEPGLQPLS